MSSGAVLADVAFNAQARVLGPMLVEPSVVGEVLLAVSDSEFTEGRYRLIYQAIRKLYNDGKPVDGLTVNDALGGNYNELLAEIINQTVTATNVMEYVAILPFHFRWEEAPCETSFYLLWFPLYEGGICG